MRQALIDQSETPLFVDINSLPQYTKLRLFHLVLDSGALSFCCAYFFVLLELKHNSRNIPNVIKVIFLNNLNSR